MFFLRAANEFCTKSLRLITRRGQVLSSKPPQTSDNFHATVLPVHDVWKKIFPKSRGEFLARVKKVRIILVLLMFLRFSRTWKNMISIEITITKTAVCVNLWRARRKREKWHERTTSQDEKKMKNLMKKKTIKISRKYVYFLNRRK